MSCFDPAHVRLLPRFRRGHLSLHRIRNRVAGLEDPKGRSGNNSVHDRRTRTFLKQALQRVDVRIKHADFKVIIVIAFPLEHPENIRIFSVENIVDLERGIMDAAAQELGHGAKCMCRALEEVDQKLGHNFAEGPTQFNDCYLDTVWSDKEQTGLVDVGMVQSKDNPVLLELYESRKRLAKEAILKYYDQEIWDYVESTTNTAQAEAAFMEGATADEDVVLQRFRLLADRQVEANSRSDMHFNEFVSLLLQEASDEWEIGDDMLFHEHSLEIGAADLYFAGIGNSMIGGTLARGSSKVSETKSTHNDIAYCEATALINYAASRERVPIPPTTCQPKDERIKGDHVDLVTGEEKTAKKVKLFDPVPGPINKIDRVALQSDIDRIHLRPDVGTFVGVKLVGGALDAFMRTNLALQLGIPYIENNDEGNALLKDLSVAGCDYTAFEYNHDPKILLIKNLSKYLRLAGFRNHNGVKQEHLCRLYAANIESEVLPDLRPGGANLCFSPPPVIYCSGRGDTLKDNSKKNRMYMRHSAYHLQRTTGITLNIETVNAINCFTHQGDDSLVLDREQDKAIVNNISKACGNPKCKTEDVGPFLAEFDEKRNLVCNGAPSFCKAHFYMEDGGVIIGRRDNRNQYKVYMKNTSGLNIHHQREECRSNMYTSHGDKVAQMFIKSLDRALAEFAPERVRAPVVKEQQRPYGVETGYPEAHDTHGSLVPLPTPAEVKRVLIGNPNDKQNLIAILGYHRGILFNVGVNFGR